MAVINYAANTAAAFNALIDSLNFDNTSISAASLQFQLSGANLMVGVNGQFMTLLNTSYASLGSANLSFANGSLFVRGAAGSGLLNGSLEADYFELTGAGDVQAAGGNGNDVFNLGATLNSADRISGGAGTDELRLAGNYAAPVVLDATTVTGVETFQIGTGGTVRLTLQDGVFTGLSSSLSVDASTQAASDALVLDASQVGTLINPSYAYLNVTSGAGNDSVFTGAGNDSLSTGAGNDVLKGGAGDDSLYAGIGNDALWGESGNDTLNGDDGNDTLEGGDGNDTLNGGAGNDVLVGGAGDDTLVGGMDADTLTGGTGNDTFRFGFGSPRTESSQSTVDTITDFATGDKIDLPGTNYINNLPLAFVEAETAFRTDDQPFNAGNLGVRPGSNPGDGFVDVMWRYSAGLNQVELWVDGNDDGQFSEVDTFVTLKSNLTGKTTFTAADLVDNFVAWRGTDGGDNFGPGTAGVNISADNLAYGLGGNDVLDGGIGSDQLYGGLGNDQLTGGEGSDSLYGGSGADTLDGGNGGDSLIAEGDNAPGVSGADAAGTVNILNGGAGNDYLSGGAGDDQLNGQADDDTLYGDAGNDTLDGGDGNDTLNGDAGTDSLFGGAGNDTFSAGASGGARGTFIDTMDGGAGNDVFNLGIYGSSDRSVMTGGAGADTFVLGAGSTQFEWASSSNVSPVSSTDRITDFNAAEGDVLKTWITEGLGGGSRTVPLVWRGAAQPGFTATVGQSLSLASGGAIESRFLELWTSYDAGTDKTALFMDRNRDGLVDANDYKLEFNGNLVSNANAALNLGVASFSAGTYTVKVGTAGNDTDTSPALGNAADIAYGLGGDDTLNGMDGDDTLNGDAGNDSLTGGLGRDYLFGGSGNDELNGGVGADILNGGSGADVLTGGDDGDYLYAEGSADAAGSPAVADAAGTVNILNGGAGNDRLYGGAGDDQLNGQADDDDLYGDAGSDTLDGGDGNDTLNGDAGTDSLFGGAGNDTFSAGASGGARGTFIDTMDGGAGNDVFNLGIYGSSDRSVMTGGAGADTFVLGADSTQFEWASSSNVSPVSSTDRITDFNAAEGDVLKTWITEGLTSGNVPLVWRGAAQAGFTATAGQSAPGTDLGTGVLQIFSYYDAATNLTGLYMDRNRDGLVDDSDFKLLFNGKLSLGANAFSAGTFINAAGVGTGGADTITGTAGDDTMVGGAGDDTLSGLGGNDRIQGDVGNDRLDGGDSNDQVWGNAGNDVLSGGAGDDSLDGGLGADTLSGGDGNDSLSAASDASDSVGTVNVLNGGAGNDTLYGSGGDDQLNGQDGSDYLYGGEGLDTLDGGAGADTNYASGGNDRIIYDTADTLVNGGSGLDLLVLRPGANLASINLGDSADQTSGDTAVVTEMDGVDFSALAGPVTFSGSDNTDWLIGTNANDTFTGLDGDDLLDGGAGADTLNSGGGNDLLNGGAGNDTLVGGTGDDTYVVDAAGDTVTELNGAGTDTVQSTVSFTLGGFVENLTLLDAAPVVNATASSVGKAALALAATAGPAINGTGNALANVIIGNSGNNTLTGLAGADTLTGGGGADRFSDTAANLNGDRITDLGLDDFIDVSGVRFSALRYSQATGLLELDTSGNGSFATKINLSTGLVGEFVAKPSAAGQAASTTVRLMQDSDGDGVGDFRDNAILVSNADQRDTDGDGYGNVVDADLNNDLFVDFADLSMFEEVFFSEDANADFNGDGLVDFADLSMLEELFFQSPGPSAIDTPVPAGQSPAATPADSFNYSALTAGGEAALQWTATPADGIAFALAQALPVAAIASMDALLPSAHHAGLDMVELGLIGVTPQALHELVA